MNENIKKLLDEYLVEVIENEDYFEIWRNGKMFKIHKDYDDDFTLEVVLMEFCMASPISDKIGKRDFPEFFKKPEKGDYIAVKRFSNSNDYNYNFQNTVSMYSVRKFIEFRDDKIVCENQKGDKESLYDFYQIFDGVNHPSTTFWFNSYHNRVHWLVLEKMFEEYIKNGCKK